MIEAVKLYAQLLCDWVEAEELALFSEFPLPGHARVDQLLIISEANQRWQNFCKTLGIETSLSWREYLMEQN